MQIRQHLRYQKKNPANLMKQKLIATTTLRAQAAGLRQRSAVTDEVHGALLDLLYNTLHPQSCSLYYACHF